MKQIARELTNFEDGFLNSMRYLLLDRDTKFCAAFRKMLKDEGKELCRSSCFFTSRRRPFPDVAVCVVQAPSVGAIATDIR